MFTINLSLLVRMRKKASDSPYLDRGWVTHREKHVFSREALDRFLGIYVSRTARSDSVSRSNRVSRSEDKVVWKADRVSKSQNKVVSRSVDNTLSKTKHASISKDKVISKSIDNAMCKPDHVSKSKEKTADKSDHVSKSKEKVVDKSDVSKTKDNIEDKSDHVSKPKEKVVDKSGHISKSEDKLVSISEDKVSQMDFTILISWMSPLPILQLLGVFFHVYSNCNTTFC